MVSKMRRKRREISMKKILLYLTLILLPVAGGLFLAERFQTDLEISVFDCQMKEWKRREKSPERM